MLLLNQQTFSTGALNLPAGRESCCCQKQGFKQLPAVKITALHKHNAIKKLNAGVRAFGIIIPLIGTGSYLLLFCTHFPKIGDNLPGCHSWQRSHLFSDWQILPRISPFGLFLAGGRNPGILMAGEQIVATCIRQSMKKTSISQLSEYIAIRALLRSVIYMFFLNYFFIPKYRSRKRRAQLYFSSSRDNEIHYRIIARKHWIFSS